MHNTLHPTPYINPERTHAHAHAHAHAHVHAHAHAHAHSQVATFDDWGQIARVHSDEDGELDFGTAVFFMSFLLIVSFTLLPVVVAVLLDNFTQATRKEKDKLLMEKQACDEEIDSVGVLDPLVRRLLSASTEDELKKTIASIFSRLDSDMSGTINSHELQEGMKKLQNGEKVDLSREAFHALTDNGRLCLDDGEVDIENFEIIMRNELTKFCNRQLALSIPAVLKNDQHMGILMFAVKLVLDKCSSERDRPIFNDYEMEGEMGLCSPGGTEAPMEDRPRMIRRDSVYSALSVTPQEVEARMSAHAMTGVPSISETGDPEEDAILPHSTRSHGLRHFGDDDSSHSTHSNSLRHLGEYKKTLATSFTLGLRPPALTHTKSVSVSV